MAVREEFEIEYALDTQFHGNTSFHPEAHDSFSHFYKSYSIGCNGWRRSLWARSLLHFRWAGGCNFDESRCKNGFISLTLMAMDSSLGKNSKCFWSKTQSSCQSSWWLLFTNEFHTKWNVHHNVPINNEREREREYRLMLTRDIQLLACLKQVFCSVCIWFNLTSLRGKFCETKLQFGQNLDLGKGILILRYFAWQTSNTHKQVQYVDLSVDPSTWVWQD